MSVKTGRRDVKHSKTRWRWQKHLGVYSDLSIVEEKRIASKRPP